jgi:hypothetical protein
MTISHEPEIPKEIRTLLAKGIAGQRCKSKTVFRFTRSVFPGFIISERILVQLMTRVEGMNQRDIGDQISRRRKSVEGTGYIEASQTGNNVIAARGIVICIRNSNGQAEEGKWASQPW